MPIQVFDIRVFVGVGLFGLVEFHPHGLQFSQFISRGIDNADLFFQCGDFPLGSEYIRMVR